MATVRHFKANEVGICCRFHSLHHNRCCVHSYIDRAYPNNKFVHLYTTQVKCTYYYYHETCQVSAEVNIYNSFLNKKRSINEKIS